MRHVVIPGRAGTCTSCSNVCADIIPIAWKLHLLRTCRRPHSGSDGTDGQAGFELCEPVGAVQQQHHPFYFQLQPQLLHTKQMRQ